MHRLSVLVPCFLSFPSVAQVTMTATTWTALQVSATGGTPVTVPANTLLAGSIPIQSSGSSPTHTANALTRVTVDTSLPRQQWVRIEDQASATSSGLFTVAGGVCGLPGLFPLHEVLVSVQAPTRVYGAWEIEYQLATTGGGQVGMMIDLGNDGTTDVVSYGQPLRVRIAVTLAPGTSVLRTRTGVFASVNPSSPPQASAAQSLTVRFVPDAGCSVATVAAPCSTGPWLTTSPNFLRGIDVHASGLFPTIGFGALVAGMSQQITTLPLPPGCLMSTNVLTWDPVQASASGTWDFPIDLRLVARPMMFRLQLLWWEPTSSRLLASEALQVFCQ